MSLIRPSDYGYAVLLWVYLQVRLSFLAPRAA